MNQVTRLSRLLRTSAVLGVLALGAGACSGEEPPYDDGGQGLPLAGLGSQIEDAGVDVVSPGTPSSASTDEVVDALTEADVASADVVDDGADEIVAFDPERTAGLLDVVADGPGTTVVLVFTTPDAAAVFAAGDPEVFADAQAEAARDALLSGNLVGYASGDGSADLRTALESLGDSAS
ncbi:MAG: hypothetical protein JWN84_4401 [Nocardioides sp.]|nr:hypothetical protein [Nocardioides sp.]